MTPQEQIDISIKNLSHMALGNEDIKILIQTAEAVRDAEVPKKRKTRGIRLEGFYSEGFNTAHDFFTPLITKKDLEIKALTEEVKALREIIGRMLPKDWDKKDIADYVVKSEEYERVRDERDKLQAENKKLAAELALLNKEHEALKGNNILLEEENRKLRLSEEEVAKAIIKYRIEKENCFVGDTDLIKDLAKQICSLQRGER